MPSAWARIRTVFAERGPHGLARFARKAAWERLPLRPVTMPFGPGHLQIEVSGKCNLKCPMCPRTFSDQGWENLSFAAYCRMIDSSPGIWSVNLQGFGEPLLNPELEQIVRFTRERGIDVGFATNATLLDERRAKALLDAGVDWLNISLDGATRETFERIRVGARFDRVLDNVRGLVRLNREAGERVHLAIAFVAMRSNLHEVPALLTLAMDLGIDRVVLAPVLDLTALVPAERLTPEDLLQLGRFRDAGLSRGLRVTVGVPGERLEPGEYPCSWPWNRAYVTAGGKVTPCCIENERSIGNAADGILKVWNGDEYRRLRAGLVEGDPHAICRSHCFTEARPAPSAAGPVATRS